MRKIDLGGSGLEVSNVSLGCMRMGDFTAKEAGAIISKAYEGGIDFFEHADIYGKGVCEEVFAKGLAESGIKREEIFIQTKCGIRPDLGTFDFSREHILASVEKSLKRLDTDYLDVLALHRPDALMQPEEIAAIFDELHTSGKVRAFGVSNHTPLQMQLLQKYVSQKLIVNQMQLSIMHTPMLDFGMNANMANEAAINRHGEIIEHCRLNDITIQAWSPYQYGFFEGVFVDNPKFPTLNAKLQEVADTYYTTPTGIATAWILRHPANMQVVIGTMNKERLAQITSAAMITISREEWYDIYKAAGNILP